MALRELDEVVEKLGQKARAMMAAMPEAEPGFLDSMVPQRPGASEAELSELEQALGGRLPDGLRAMLLTYEISGLELAGVIFGGEGTFCDFLRQQLDDPESAWGSWYPEGEFIVIAASSGYVLFASMADGRIWCCNRDHPFGQRHIVSASLSLLIRALGTLVLTESIADEAAFGSELATATEARGSEAFWLELILGHG